MSGVQEHSRENATRLERVGRRGVANRKSSLPIGLLALAVDVLGRLGLALRSELGGRLDELCGRVSRSTAGDDERLFSKMVAPLNDPSKILTGTRTQRGPISDSVVFGASLVRFGFEPGATESIASVAGASRICSVRARALSVMDLVVAEPDLAIGNREGGDVVDERFDLARCSRHGEGLDRQFERGEADAHASAAP